MLRGLMLAIMTLAIFVPSSTVAVAQEANAPTPTTAPASEPERGSSQVAELFPEATPAGGQCSGVGADFAILEVSALAATSPAQSDAVKERLLPVSDPVTVEAPSLSVSVNSDRSLDLEFRQISSQDQLQIVGTFTNARRRRIAFEHNSACKGAIDSSVVAEVYEDGSASLTIMNDGNVSQTIGVYEPWAVDAAGEPVDTWYEASGSTLTQIVDARGRTGPFTFDPTYTTLNCAGYFSDRDSWFYLNTSPSDGAYCPVMGMFKAANNYTPVWGFETNVANDYGKIIIRQDGGCSNSPDTGWAWDFQVPCKAHDYCYDLRKASFSGTVSDSDCDSSFYWIMEAHCNNRLFSGDCRIVRNSYFAAVSLPWVVTNPNPQGVNIKSKATGKCVDLEGPSSANGTPIQQWSCVGVANQRWTIWPGSTPGYFRIQTHSAGNKYIRVSNVVYQYALAGYSSMEFKIQGALNQDQYSIRSRNKPNECWKVPVSYTNGVNLIDPTCNDFSNWWIWRITDA